MLKFLKKQWKWLMFLALFLAVMGYIYVMLTQMVSSNQPSHARTAFDKNLLTPHASHFVDHRELETHVREPQALNHEQRLASALLVFQQHLLLGDVEDTHAQVLREKLTESQRSSFDVVWHRFRELGFPSQSHIYGLFLQNVLYLSSSEPSAQGLSWLVATVQRAFAIINPNFPSELHKIDDLLQKGRVCECADVLHTMSIDARNKSVQLWVEKVNSHAQLVRWLAKQAAAKEPINHA